MINHIKVICICILSLLLCSIETHAVRGAGGDFTFNAAGGKGDMIVGALQTDNFANSDSNDFSFSFNPDAMMDGKLGDVSIGGGQSEYAGSGNDYIGSTINAGGTVSGQANDMNIIDSQITGDKVEIDLAGNLTIETTPDTWQGSGSSWNANIGTGGFGGGVGEITEDKSWTETPAGIFGKSEVNIDVGDTTKLIGGAIVSETDGGLNLVTGDLVVEDVAINDYARDEYTGGQVNVNLGGVISGDIDHSNDTKKDDLFNENKYGTIEHSDVGHDKQGVIKGTISGGTVTVGGTRDEDGNVIGGEVLDVAKLEDMGINTDSDNIVTITKDESWEESFKVDLVNVGIAAEQVDNLVNVVESFAAKAPDHIKADGKEGEDIWRKAIANGMSQDEATSFAGTQEYADLVEIRQYIEQDKDENGRYNANTVYAALQLETARMQGYYDANCASGFSSIGACRQLGEALASLIGDGATSVDDLSVEKLNAMINGFKQAMGAGDGASQTKYAQIVDLAQECKDIYLSKSSNMYAEYNNPNIDLKQELLDMGYDPTIVNNYTMPAFAILDALEKGKITKEEAKDKINNLRNNLSDYQTDIDKMTEGEGIDKRWVDADYRTALMNLDDGLESLSNGVVRDNMSMETLINTSELFSSDLLPEADLGYSASPREIGESAVAAAEWVPVVGDVMDGGRCVSGEAGSCAMVLVPSLIEKGIVLVKVGGKYAAKRLDDGAELTSEQVGDIVGDSKVFAHNSDATIMGRIEYDYVDGQKIEKFMPDDNYYDM